MKKSYCYWQSIDLNISGGRANYFFFPEEWNVFSDCESLWTRALFNIFLHLKNKHNWASRTHPIFSHNCKRTKISKHIPEAFWSLLRQRSGSVRWLRKPIYILWKQVVCKIRSTSERPPPNLSGACWDSSATPPLVLIELWVADCCVGGPENVLFRAMEG